MSTGTIEIPFVNSRPPDWASGYGQDRYGYFAAFSVATGPRYWEFITQRMRWIPPGTFQMGVADGETPSFGKETRHPVTLSRGFWLADTACTQELWEAVMGSNPSNFKDAKRMLRPVEQVSFDDVSEFLEKLNQRVPHGMLTLPTESQWEYACRAGTTTPFSFGDTISTDQVNFDGNRPYGDSPKGEYRQETVDVKSLPANRWGLYEMHGNVWEWCSDWYAEYSPESQVDPVGPATGSHRVRRGGSWFNYARIMRSACRYWYDPGNRFNSLGFRLLSSASPDRNQRPNK